MRINHKTPLLLKVLGSDYTAIEKWGLSLSLLTHNHIEIIFIHSSQNCI
jgi:hypothetical protein